MNMMHTALYLVVWVPNKGLRPIIPALPLQSPLLKHSGTNMSKKCQWHVFLSELVRQKLEELRTNRRHQAATVTQALWRGYVVRKKWPHLLRQLEMKKTRSRPRPITGTPEPGGWELQDNSEMSVNYGPPHLSGRSRSEPRFGSCDLDIIQNTCSMFGLDLVRWHLLISRLISNNHLITGETSSTTSQQTIHRDG